PHSLRPKSPTTTTTTATTPPPTYGGAPHAAAAVPRIAIDQPISNVNYQKPVPRMPPTRPTSPPLHSNNTLSPAPLPALSLSPSTTTTLSGNDRGYYN